MRRGRGAGMGGSGRVAGPPTPPCNPSLTMTGWARPGGSTTRTLTYYLPGRCGIEFVCLEKCGLLEEKGILY